MKNSDGKRHPLTLFIICVALIVLASQPLLSSARSPATSVDVVNNSSRGIRNIYLSPVDSDDWSDDQLGESTIAPGQSRTISLSCSQSQIKLIGEDDDGCFLVSVVSCSTNSSWTITSETSRDCGN